MEKNPVESEKALEVLNDKCLVSFEDTSYVNDLCDSVTHTTKLQERLVVYFPNFYGANPSEDEEQYTTFSVYFEDEKGDLEWLSDDNEEEVFSLEEAITIINKFVLSSDNSLEAENK